MIGVILLSDEEFSQLLDDLGRYIPRFIKNRRRGAL